MIKLNPVPTNPENTANIKYNVGVRIMLITCPQNRTWKFPAHTARTKNRSEESLIKHYLSFLSDSSIFLSFTLTFSLYKAIRFNS